MSLLIDCHAESPYAECRYAECRYADCRYTECRYVVSWRRRRGNLKMLFFHKFSGYRLKTKKSWGRIHNTSFSLQLMNFPNKFVC